MKSQRFQAYLQLPITNEFFTVPSEFKDALHAAMTATTVGDDKSMRKVEGATP